MAHTNKTANYELPIFIGTDKPSWMNDWNYLTTKLDTTIKAIADAVAGDTVDIEELKTTIEELKTSVGLLETSVSTIDGKVLTIEGDVSLLKTGQQTLSSTLATTNGEVAKNKASINLNTESINDVDEELDRTVLINKVAVNTSGWSLDAPYTQDILVSGMRADAYPTYDVELDPTLSVETQQSLLDGFSCITNMITYNGSIKLICNDTKPEYNFNIIVKGV